MDLGMKQQERQIDGCVESRLLGVLRAEEKRLGCSLGIPTEIICSGWVGEAEMKLRNAMTARTHYIEIGGES